MRIKLQLILYLLFIFTNVKSFSMTPKFRDDRICVINSKISSRVSYLNMDYSHYKSFDDIINILPEFHTRIIINNWLKYVAPEEKTINDLMVEYERTYNNKNKIENTSQELKIFPEYLIKSLYDFKIFIAINRDEKNVIYFGWCPQPNLQKSKLAYLIAGKVYNNIIYIHRIAQNPYYEDIIDLNSIDLVKRLEEIEYKKNEKFNFNYDNLHEYDNRYKLSWDFYKD